MSVDQTTFRSAMLDPAKDVPAGLVDPQGRTAGKRFDVYRNNVAVSLTEALEVGFPVVRKLVGDEFFKAMAGVYLRKFQPGNPMLVLYGATFPGFLERFGPARQLAYLPDVSRLELAIREVYHAADARPAAPEALQALPGGDLLSARLTLAPALALVRSNWPVHTIWQANTNDTPGRVEMRPETVLVTRPDFDPVLSLLPQGGGEFIEALRLGHSFGAALGKAQAETPDFDLTTSLGALISGGAITEVIPG